MKRSRQCMLTRKCTFNEIIQYCARIGFKRALANIGTPFKNDVVEWKNCMLVQIERKCVILWTLKPFKEAWGQGDYNLQQQWNSQPIRRLYYSERLSLEIIMLRSESYFSFECLVVISMDEAKQANLFIKALPQILISSHKPWEGLTCMLFSFRTHVWDAWCVHEA